MSSAGSESRHPVILRESRNGYAPEISLMIEAFTALLDMWDRVTETYLELWEAYFVDGPSPARADRAVTAAADLAAALQPLRSVDALLGALARHKTGQRIVPPWLLVDGLQNGFVLLSGDAPGTLAAAMTPDDFLFYEKRVGKEWRKAVRRWLARRAGPGPHSTTPAR